ncbi:hypothetical protein [Pedobacter sp. UYEF25]
MFIVVSFFMVSVIIVSFIDVSVDIIDVSVVEESVAEAFFSEVHAATDKDKAKATKPNLNAFFISFVLSLIMITLINTKKHKR